MVHEDTGMDDDCGGLIDSYELGAVFCDLNNMGVPYGAICRYDALEVRSKFKFSNNNQ